jgi:hypothetical protein
MMQTGKKLGPATLPDERKMVNNKAKRSILQESLNFLGQFNQFSGLVREGRRYGV